MRDCQSTFIEAAEALRRVYELPSKGAVAKEIERIDAHCQRFIAISPFVCLGTMSADGRADVSPRGGEPGFVHVLDGMRLAMPDRPGNNRLDSFINIIANPSVGLPPGQILRDHLAIETPIETIDAFVEKDARERLY